MRMAPVLMALGVAVASSASAQNGHLTANRTRIQAGDSVVLTWDCRGFTSAYLSVAGDVPLQGTMVFSPGASTTVYLVAESPGHRWDGTVTVSVIDSRGNDEDFPSAVSFRLPRSYQSSINSTTALLTRIHDVLQNSQHFSLQELHQGRTVIFTTNRVPRQSILGSDPRYAGRRIAFRVEVPDSAAGALQYIIATLVESQRVTENTWYAEDPQPYEAEVRALAARIGIKP